MNVGGVHTVFTVDESVDAKRIVVGFDPYGCADVFPCRKMDSDKYHTRVKC